MHPHPLALLCAATAVSCATAAPPENLALQRTYALDPAPNYEGCTDPGDNVQLTDGEPTRGDGPWWTGEGCVGWSRAPLVTVTLDLGAIAPIGGLAFSTAAGGGGVGWPAAILVLVSEDGEKFRLAGELRTLSAREGAPNGEGVEVHTFRTTALRSRGRFVRLAIVATGAYVFCDEIEIYRGPDALLASAPDGPMVEDLDEFVAAHRTALAINSWIAGDADHVRKAVAAANLADDTRRRLNGQIQAIEKANQAVGSEPPPDYHAIYPLNENHRGLGRVMAHLGRAAGYPPLFAWHNDRWEILRPWDRPPEPPPEPPALTVRMVANERRGETINIANFTDETQTAMVRFSGLPGGSTPDYISVREVEYVAMQSGSWHADALPEARRSEKGWAVTLQPGVSRQLWIAIHTRESPEPGHYPGEIVIDVGKNGPQLTSPLTLIIEPFRLPDEPVLALTMWDYTAGGGYAAINRDNRAAAVAHMRSHNYNAPWATMSVFPIPTREHFDADDNLVTALDYSVFNEWVAHWPDARYYMVFVEAMVGRHKSNPFAGADIGTEEFNRRVGSTARAWADNARQAGVDPHKLAILLIDEPGGIEQAQRILAWARAIKAAAPEITIYEDTHLSPDEPQATAMLEICDILCPAIGTYRRGGNTMATGFEKLRQGGRELWFYSSPTQQAGVYYRDHAWECWKAKATGLGFWAYGDAGGTGNSWNQPGSTGPIYAPAYIDSKSVTDGKRWLAIIEGVQDYEYLGLLRDRLEDGDDSDAARAARKLLNTLPDEVLAGDIPFDDARGKILDALLSLNPDVNDE